MSNKILKTLIELLLYMGWSGACIYFLLANCVMWSIAIMFAGYVVMGIHSIYCNRKEV